MPMEEALIARLNGAATINTITGDGVPGPAGRQAISWFDRQRGDPLPGITLSKISPVREYDHSGPDRLDRPRVQIDCYARTSAAAAALHRAVRAEMEAGADVAGIRFHPAQLDGEGWTFDGEEDGGEPLYRASQDFLFYFEEL